MKTFILNIFLSSVLMLGCFQKKINSQSLSNKKNNDLKNYSLKLNGDWKSVGKYYIVKSKYTLTFYDFIPEEEEKYFTRYQLFQDSISGSKELYEVYNDSILIGPQLPGIWKLYLKKRNLFIKFSGHHMFDDMRIRKLTNDSLELEEIESGNYYLYLKIKR